jgi:predicted nuclease of predicted toxin-antitoxin system
MRILSDENVHMDIVSGLRKEGFDLVTAVEAGLAGRKDQEILEYAEEHDLLVLSGDKDFGGLLEFGKLWGSGRVLLLRYQILNPHKIVRDVVQVFRRETEAFRIAGSLLVVLSESGYRVRRPNPR